MFKQINWTIMFLFQVEIPVYLNDGLKVEGELPYSSFEMHKVPETNVFIIIKDSRYTGGIKCPCGVNKVWLRPLSHWTFFKDFQLQSLHFIQQNLQNGRITCYNDVYYTIKN